MALLTPTTVGRAGLDITAGLAAATVGGDSFATTGQEYLVVKNGDASDHTVQFLFGPGASVDGVAPVAPTHNVIAGHTAEFGPFQPGLYADAGGLVQVRYSAVTSVTVLAKKNVPAGPGQ
jgi:hypothetical protein